MQINYNYVNNGFLEWFNSGWNQIESTNFMDDMNTAYNEGFADAFWLCFSLINDASITQQDLDMALDIYIADKALNGSPKGAMLRVIRFIMETRRLQLKMEMENESDK